MATSPIYNWPEPDNTDLVKNGALAIRTLGNAIDTTMATMVPKTIVDAKGDLIAGTAADTAARLAVGANGETLVADSSTSTGLRYQASMAAGRNGTINGGMDIWQRGTSISLAAGTNAANGFTADRWFLPTGTNQASTVSRQSVGDSTNLPNIQYCARVQRNSGQTGTATMAFNYNFETANSIPFAGKTITVSFYARAGANYSPTSSVLSSQLYTGTGTDQNVQVGGFTGQNLAVNQSNTLTTTWQRFSYTYAVPSTVTQFAYIFLWTPTGTAGANDYFEITGVQMELGSVATNFSRAGGTIQGELAACQRYYYAHVSGAAKYICMAAAYSSSISNGYLQYPVTMRTTPTMAITTGTNYYLMYRNGTYQYFNTLAQDYASSTGTGATGTGLYITGLSQTAGWSGWFQSDNAASSIAFSAEL